MAVQSVEGIITGATSAPEGYVRPSTYLAGKDPAAIMNEQSSPIEVNALDKYRRRGGSVLTSVIDGYMPLAPSTYTIQQFPYHPRPAVQAQSELPQYLGYSGNIAEVEARHTMGVGDVALEKELRNVFLLDEASGEIA